MMTEDEYVLVSNLMAVKSALAALRETLFDEGEQEAERTRIVRALCKLRDDLTAEVKIV